MKKTGSTPIYLPVLAITLALAALADVFNDYLVTLPDAAAVARPVSPTGDNGAYPADTVPATIGQLFGVPVPTPAPVLPAAPPTVVSSPPRFVLSGVIGGINGMAILVDEGGHDGVYQPGDLLPGGARLEAVLEEAVQVSVGGNRYLVRIEWEDVRGAGSAGAIPVMPDGVSAEASASPAGTEH